MWEETKSDPGVSPIGVPDAELFNSVSLFGSVQLTWCCCWVQLSSSHVAAGGRDMGPSSYFTKGLSFLRWKALWVNLFAARENLCCPLNLAVVTKWVCSNSRSLAGKKERRERKPQRTSGLCHSCAQPDGREVICVHKIWGESNEERRCVSVRNSVA